MLSLVRPRPSVSLLARALRFSPSPPSHLAQRAYTRAAGPACVKSEVASAFASRHLHASASRNSVHASDVAVRKHAEIGSVISPDQKVDLRQILNDLRDLEALDKLNKSAGKSELSDKGKWGWRLGLRGQLCAVGEHAGV